LPSPKSDPGLLQGMANRPAIASSTCAHPTRSIRINDGDKTAKYLADKNPALRRAALIALDQMRSGDLIPEQVRRCW